MANKHYGNLELVNGKLTAKTVDTETLFIDGQQFIPVVKIEAATDSVDATEYPIVEWLVMVVDDTNDDNRVMKKVIAINNGTNAATSADWVSYGNLELGTMEVNDVTVTVEPDGSDTKLTVTVDTSFPNTTITIYRTVYQG
jgi:hypothetical protein